MFIVRFFVPARKDSTEWEFTPVIQIRGLNKKLITQMIDMLLFALVV